MVQHPFINLMCGNVPLLCSPLITVSHEISGQQHQVQCIVLRIIAFFLQHMLFHAQLYRTDGRQIYDLSGLPKDLRDQRISVSIHVQFKHTAVIDIL